MVVGRYKKLFLTINGLWFYDRGEDVLLDLPKSDLMYYHSGHTPPTNNSVLAWPIETVCVDLSQDMETIFSSFTSNCRNEVRRATREGVLCSWHDSNQLLEQPELLDVLQSEYDSFVADKGIKNIFNRRALEAYAAQSSGIVLTIARYDETLLAQHLYVTDGHKARLLYSVSGFRHNVELKSLYGKANRLLHYFDMEEFRTSGATLLDFGGISNFENPNGVDLFKMSFGGTPATLTNAIIGKTLLGRLVVSVLKLVKRRA